MLADEVDYVIGVDTHKTAHAAAAVSPTGAVIAQTQIAADAFGYKRLLRFAKRDVRGRRVWAIESSGSFGAGLTTFLLEHGERVVEVDRPGGRRVATARSPTNSMPFAPQTRRSTASTSRSRGSVAIVKPSACC